MKRQQWRTKFVWPAATVLAVFTSLVAGAAAGPLEDARELIQQKKYDQVDRRLNELLEQTPPSVEALRLSLEAARADGRVITAQRRCDTLLTNGGRTDPTLVHLGGRLAGLTGDTTREAELFSLFLAIAPQKSDELRHALLRLVEIGNEPQAVKKYLELYEVNDDFYRQAIAMLARLYENGEAAAFVEVCDTLLGEFESRPDLAGTVAKPKNNPKANPKRGATKKGKLRVKKKMYDVTSHMRRAADGGLFMNMPGQPADGSGKMPEPMSPGYRRYSKMAELLLKHKMHDDMQAWEFLIHSDQQTPAGILGFLETKSPIADYNVVAQCRSSRCWREMSKLIPADAGARLLALEPAYRASPDPRVHYEFIGFFAHNRWLFEDAMTLAQAEQLFLPLKERLADKPSELTSIAEGLSGYAKTLDELGGFLTRHREYVPPHVVRNFIDGKNRNDPERLAKFQKIVGTDAWTCYKGNALDWLRTGVDKDTFRQTLEQLLLKRPGGLDINQIRGAVLQHDTLTAEEKTDLLKSLYAKAGYGEVLQSLIEDGKNREEIKDSPAFKQFVKSVKKTQLGSDPALSAMARAYLFWPRHNSPADPKIHDLMAPALKAYGAKFPAGRENDDAMQLALQRYYDTCQWDGESSKRFVETVLPYAGQQAPWNLITAAASKSNDPATKLAVLETCLPMKVPASQIYEGVFHQHKTPAAGSPYLVAPFYGQISFRVCAESIRQHTEATKQWSAGLGEAARLLPTLRSEELVNDQDYRDLSSFLSSIRSWQDRDPEKKLPPAVIDVLIDKVVLPRITEHGAISHAMDALQYAGQRNRAVETYMTSVETLENVERVRALIALYERLREGRMELVIDTIFPELRQLSDFDLARVEIPRGILGDLQNEIRREDASDAIRQAWADLADFIARGMIVESYQRSDQYDLFADAVPAELEKQQYERALRLIRTTLVNCREERCRDMLTSLRDEGRWELLYISADWMPERDKQLATFAHQLRGIAAAKIPGIYPVDAAHPAFPVYVAASELSRGNEQRAWELLRDNIAAFTEHPLSYDLTFVAWGVNKLRSVRGEEDALLKSARLMCDQILAEEDTLEPAFAASMRLIRADVFRDLGNLEAAELEYKSMLSNPGLQKTPAGRHARYRLVNLMILRGNSAGASSEVDRWLTYPDPELHMQAYYFKALMAYEDEDYKQCREMLNEVFQREYGHEEARLLEGEWRKKTRSLEDTDIYAGRQVELANIKPGQELKLSIQDKNLSVIGEESSIPVVVTTSSGQDRELVNLYPFPRTPNLFRSRLTTRLGDAQPGNLVLEVNGADTISYEVDPEFIRNRGLTPLPVRSLGVVDDAWLSASAGRLLTEEEEKDLAVRRQVAAIRGEKLDDDLARNARVVRPGNPLYAMVRDRDRDVSSQPDVVPVRLTTTTGDVLGAVSLTETGPHTGVFRGEVPTDIPLPRASASDSADGSDPAVMINSMKEGIWSSRADAQPDKWVEVDTMASHVVAQTRMMVPDPSTVRRLTLYGELLGDPVRLASYPASTDAAPGGLTLTLRRQSLNANEATLAKIRAGMRDTGDDSVRLEQPIYDQAREQGHTGHISGFFFFDEGQNVALTMQCEDPGDSRAYILVDGNVVHGGEMRRVVASAKSVYLAAGAHRLDVFFYQHGVKQNFSVGRLVGGEFETLPKQWFSVEDSEQLAEFLQDKAVITKTDGGFVAEFDKPTRLRRLRWQFNEYAGASVRVASIDLTDADGEVVLPVEHDFSTGLENDTLELAPGDRVTVAYRDGRTHDGTPRTLTADLSAGFSNARVAFQYEVSAGVGQRSRYAEAYRFKPGMQQTITVVDPDADVSPDADTVDVVVRSVRGEELQLTAQETPQITHRTGDPIHSGVFLAIVKTSLTEATGGDTIRVAAVDSLEGSFEDRENTDPGVPIVRSSAPLPTVGDTKSEVTFFRAWSEMAPDPRSPEGEMVERVDWLPLDEKQAMAATIVTDAAHPIRFQVKNAGRALHGESTIIATAVAQSEIDAAKEESREPNEYILRMKVKSGTEAEPNSIFVDEVTLQLGRLGLLTDTFESINRRDEVDELTGPVPVVGADTVYISILGPDGTPELRKGFRLATEGTIALLDKSYEEPRTDVHMGERFHVQVVDADQDLSPEHDTIRIRMYSDNSPAPIEHDLTETLPHSGVFNGSIRTVFAGEKPGAPADRDAAVDTVDGIALRYGESVTFSYDEQTTIPGVEPGDRSVSGKVLLGDDGSVGLFSKRYGDAERAARVQFRMAECLFELAKEYRKVGNPDMATEAISRGKLILEEAMQDYPNTSLVTEGIYLLANLHEELASEQLAQENETEAIKLYQQAVSRFSTIISTWPDSPYAARSQYHKAMCLEKIGDHKQASEEYVRLCYAYPDSPLVADATVRLAAHYYKQDRYDVSGRIYESFARKHPGNPRAPKVLFMAAQCHLKQAEVWSDPEFEGDARLIGRDVEDAVRREYLTGAKGLDHIVDNMQETAGSALRSQAMYWSGIAYRKADELEKAYLRIKQVTFEYPETKWARMARGLLLQDEQLQRLSEVK